MKFRHSMWAMAFAAFVMGGCSEDPGNDPGPDVIDPDVDGGNEIIDDPIDDPTEDPDVVSPGEKTVGEICNDNVECQSGLCIALGQGINEGFCTQRCPDPDPNIPSPDCPAGVELCVSRGTTGSGDELNVCFPSNDCLDRDSDNYGLGPGCLGADCDDTNPNVNPEADETCNGRDDNCNGTIDERVIEANTPCSTGLDGICDQGRFSCVDAELECNVVIQPGTAAEVCDGLDNDCDGLADEGESIDENANFVNGLGLPCSSGGGCADGLTVCNPLLGIVCESEGGGETGDAICDNQDNDCDGAVDEDVAGLGEICVVGLGVCQRAGVRVCDPGDTGASGDDLLCSASADTSQQGPESCDYQDNDCDGDVDEDFTNASGIYDSVQNCGACGINCNNLWQPSPAALNVVPTCDVSGSGAVCGFDCAPGFFDADGSEANGCELDPDENAIYVARPGAGGTDNGTCGDYTAPCATITFGIQRAQAAGRSRVRVAAGNYAEGVVMLDGISVLGGHSPLNWTRDPVANNTQISGAIADGANRIGVRIANVTSATELSGFTITPPDGDTSGSSIGVYVRNSNNNLLIQDNVIAAGVGGDGAAGASGDDGQNGVNGQNGNQGRSDLNNCTNSNRVTPGNGGQLSCPNLGGAGTTNVSGGQGAFGDCPEYAAPGDAPEPGLGPAPGTEGFTAWGRRGYTPSGSNRLCFPAPDRIQESFAEDGGPGSRGTDGQGGSGASNADGVVTGSGLWSAAPGTSGAPGGPGSGGGGGGAAHGIEECNSSGTGCGADFYVGASGGGGGSGGCAGNAGGAGAGGGGSFGIFIYRASGSALPQIINNEISRGQGGQGGDGGIGGKGGDGGVGGVGGIAGPDDGTYGYCHAPGRQGGNGGRGGHGGGGGGGAGGASYDIFVAVPGVSSASFVDDNTFSLDASSNTGGNGGPGGGSLGNDGQNGASGSFGRIYFTN